MLLKVLVPIQFLGPSPNGKNVYGGILVLFSSVNRSGLYFSGSGKYSESKCNPATGIKMATSSSKVNPVSSKVYLLADFRFKKLVNGYFLNVSKIICLRQEVRSGEFTVYNHVQVLHFVDGVISEVPMFSKSFFYFLSQSILNGEVQGQLIESERDCHRNRVVSGRKKRQSLSSHLDVI
jgi:hypothetical protein